MTSAQLKSRLPQEGSQLVQDSDIDELVKQAKNLVLALEIKGITPIQNDMLVLEYATYLFAMALLRAGAAVPEPKNYLENYTNLLSLVNARTQAVRNKLEPQIIRTGKMSNLYLRK